jgi:hypothetical protein
LLTEGMESTGPETDLSVRHLFGSTMRRLIWGRCCVWLHKDLGWWAFWISIVTLIAAYPLEVLAHITAPKWKNWWAERSAAAMRKRIENLEKQLADHEQNYEVVSPVEDMILKGIEATGQLLVLCVQLIVVAFVLGIQHFAPQSASIRDVASLLFLAMFVSAIGYVVAFAVLEKISLFRKNRSPSNREALRKNIEELKRQLARRN